jgi:hypothetical protein
MDSRLAVQIGSVLFVVALFVGGWWKAGRALKAQKQAFQDLGSSWSFGFGTCLAGLPGLDQPAKVACGGTATELIFLADADNRELCRIPWSAIVNIFSGNEEETHLHLGGGDAPPSLILAQSDHTRADGRHRYVPSYAVIDWSDGASRRKQAVFEFQGPRWGSINAHYLTSLKMRAGQV